MAFIRTNYTRSSSQWNSGVFNTDSYVSTTDTLAVIKASAYFNTIITELAVNDWIKIVGSDGYDIVVVTSVTTNVTVVPLLGNAPPSDIIKFSGQITTSAGPTIVNYPLTGVDPATDKLFVQILTQGAVPVTILAAGVLVIDQIKLEFSADPGNDHVFSYLVTRLAT